MTKLHTADWTFRTFEGMPSALPEPEGWVAFDTETSGLHPDDGARVSVVSVAWLEGTEIVTAAWPWGQGGKNGSEVYDSGEVEWECLMAWIERREGLIAHNAKFDMHMMRAGTKTGLPGCNLAHLVRWDTMVAAKELWPSGHVALKPLSAALFGEDASAEQAALKPHLGPQTNPRFDLVPWPVMAPYAAKDTTLTLRLYHEQRQRAEEGYAGAQWISREMAVLQALYTMEVAGIPYDPELSRAIDDDLRQKQEAIAAALPFAPKDAKKWYFTDSLPGSMGLPAYHKTDKGAVSMTAETLELMVRDDLPHAAELARHNKIATARRMWYGPYADRTDPAGRLRCSFRQVASGWGASGGTASGRFSVERVNLQAIPQDYRVTLDVPTPRGVIAAAASKFDGWGLYELDLAQAELRVAAMWAECGKMLDAIREDRDVHGETAKELFDISPDHEDWGKMRQVAKRANFSLIFGSGWKTFRNMIAKEAGLYLPVQEAKRIVYGWNDIYPEYADAIQDSMDYVAEHRYVALAGGRFRFFKPGEDHHKAFNQRVQASLAELGKSWLLKSHERFRDYPERGLEAGIGRAGLLMVIHDSQVLLLPKDEAQATLAAVRQDGVDVWADMFPSVPGDIEYKEW